MEFDVVSPPDESVRQAAEERHTRLTKPLGALGLLEELGTWIAACQGQCPPKPIERARVVVFAGDHGVAGRGVSAYPSEVTAQMVANFQAGGAAINVLAGVAGATVRVVDMSVAVDTPAGDWKVRRSSGSIDHEDALTEDEVTQALAAGRAIADEEVDSGADLLVAGDMGIGNTTPAAVLVAAITGSEPVAVVGRGTGIDDHTWMRKTAAIRDALRRAKPVTADPVALLRTTAGADITAMAGFLAQAAIRRTPVVLDGVISGAAALMAEELAPGARAWWVAGHRSTEPAHTLVLEQLDLHPLLELNMRLGEGSGATAAIPLLTMAARILTDMATFEDAGVSDRAAPGGAEEQPGVESAAAPTEAATAVTEGATETGTPEHDATGSDATGSAGATATAGEAAASPRPEKAAEAPTTQDDTTGSATTGSAATGGAADASAPQEAIGTATAAAAEGRAAAPAAASAANEGGAPAAESGPAAENATTSQPSAPSTEPGAGIEADATTSTTGSAPAADGGPAAAPAKPSAPVTEPGAGLEADATASTTGGAPAADGGPAADDAGKSEPSAPSTEPGAGLEADATSSTTGSAPAADGGPVRGDAANSQPSAPSAKPRAGLESGATTSTAGSLAAVPPKPSATEPGAGLEADATSATGGAPAAENAAKPKPAAPSTEPGAGLEADATPPPSER